MPLSPPPAAVADAPGEEQLFITTRSGILSTLLRNGLLCNGFDIGMLSGAVQPILPKNPVSGPGASL
jgi:hypothetical protein